MIDRQRSVVCPICRKSVAWTPDNRFRPFCSERCKLIDLGAWASEAYRAPVSEDPRDPEDSEPGAASS